MGSDRWDLGRRGEDIAADYLRQRGWVVLARNFRAGPRELDLVATRRGVVAFVEVKTRSTTTGGTPLEPIRALKRRAVESAARRWILEHGRPGVAYRFDAIAVKVQGDSVHVEHIPDAWRPGG